MILGWVGFSLVAISFILLNSKFSNYFLLLNSIGTFLLIIYSILINDYPFIFVNLLICISLITKMYRGGIK